MARRRTSLAGTWRFEPLARTVITAEGIAEDASGLPAGGEAPVPSNWVDHGLAGFDGRVRYTRTFEHAASDAASVHLCFEGVDYFATVALNGEELGTHEGCFDAFSFDVTGVLREGTNELEVLVDAPREAIPDPYPHRKRQLKGIFVQWDPLDRWMETTGGIWGDVYLEERPDPWIAHVQVTPFLVPTLEAVPAAGADRGLVDRPDGGRAAWVRLRVELASSRRRPVRIEAEVGDGRAALDVAVPPGTSTHDVIVEVPEPRLWWTWDHGEPALTAWTVRCGDDAAGGRTGIREVRLDEATGWWWLNGRRIFARGTNLVPEKWLSRYGEEHARRDARLVRDANLNLARVCVHVARDALYDAFDELGVLVWQDTPLQWDYTPSPDLAAEAGRQSAAMVRRLCNHPSVALWSCQNEPFRSNRETIARVVEAAVRQADASRTVHLASDFSEHAYPGWFAGHAAQYASLPGAPMPSEFGAQALPSADETRELVGDVWPPDEKVWAEAGFEPTFWYRIAGVKPTGTLGDYVQASQRYQADIAQRAIETYRSARGDAIGSILHFLFCDGWPQISWSVLSYARVPKLAYAAVARAMQPVLICATQVRSELGADWDSWRAPPVAGLRVINDLAEPLEGAAYEVTLGEAVLASGTVDVPADGIAWIETINTDDWLAWEPPELPPGEHEVVLRLAHGGRTVSENAYRVQVI